MGRMTSGAVEAARRLSELLPQRVNPRSQAQVTKFFDGLELVEPGVVPIQQWRPDSDEEAAAPASLWAASPGNPDKPTMTWNLSRNRVPGPAPQLRNPPGNCPGDPKAKAKTNESYLRRAS
jgi:hypothetical protein